MTLLSGLRRAVGRAGKKHASFRLEYKPAADRHVTVGHLRFEDGVWSFEYDQAYRRRPDLRPIEGFDDLSKIYRSRSLFPFFAVRVPDEGRSDVRLRLKQEHIDEPDESDLLRMFGRRAVASPAFELIEDPGSR